jgi:NADH-quinone oxidoreductase subunit L
MDFAVQYSFLIPLLPLVAAGIAGFFGARWLKGASHWPVWIALGLGAVVSFTLLGNMLTQIGAHEATSIKRHIYTWIEAGGFRADVGFFLDPLSIIMLCIVTGIGLLIAIFSAGYMAGESGYFRFFAYIGMFIFSMTCVIMGENLILLYLGWEAVGLCSYLLIGYYYERPAAREAAKKAFLVNRVGDFGFALGIMLTYLAFGTISYFGDGVGTNTGFLEMAYMIAMGKMDGTELQHLAIDWVPFLLMAGAFGKSAQFPLYVWLPDAMEGPTRLTRNAFLAASRAAGRS